MKKINKDEWKITMPMNLYADDRVRPKKTISAMTLNLYADEEGRISLIDKKKPAAAMSFTSFSPIEAPIKLMGYRGFISAVWMLWRMNRASRAAGVTTEARIRLPIRWLR